MLKKLWAIREEVKEKKPLVYNITNNVVTNFTANVLLASGVLPIMSEGVEEAEELAKITDAVVLNIGTLHPRQVDYFMKAGELANKYNKPVIVDPVGVGATSYRNKTAFVLLKELRVSLVRGNCGEVGFLTGITGKTKGVDSLDSEIDLGLLKALAQKTRAIAAATGKTDYLSDGERILTNGTGHELLQLVTGTGCALTSLMGAFMTASEDRMLGALSALAFYGAAAEKAAESCKGPGSFAANFLDALYNLTYDEFMRIAEEKIKN